LDISIAKPDATVHTMPTSIPSTRPVLPLILLVLLSSLATAFPLNAEPELLVPRATLICPAGNPCGYSTQVCCGAGFACYTDANNHAQCTVYNPAATAGGAAVATATSTLICNGNVGQSACGSVCCNVGQTCAAAGTCVMTSATATATATATITSVVPGVVVQGGTTVTMTSTSVAAGRLLPPFPLRLEC
jgi:hypothetical protein